MVSVSVSAGKLGELAKLVLAEQPWALAPTEGWLGPKRMKRRVMAH